MSRRLPLAALLTAGLAGLTPTPVSAQAPPIQEDPLAREHVLRLPPANASGGAAPAYGAPQPGLPSVQSPQYGGQPGQAYQGGGAYQAPYGSGQAPRYGGSLLGAPNGQVAPGATPVYGTGQPPAPVYGGSPPSAAAPQAGAAAPQVGAAAPQAGAAAPQVGAAAPQVGAAAPPLQSPRYDANPAGQPGVYGNAPPAYPRAAPNPATASLAAPGSAITQEPLAPLPSPAAPSQASQQPASQSPSGANPPDATAPQTQASLPAQSAAPQAGSDAPANRPGAGSSGQASPGTAGDTPGSAPAVPAPPNIWLPAGVATLQALDKVNAQASTLTVKVGQSATFGSLTITVKSCVVRPADQPPDAAAFVDVTDSHPDTSGFSGWLLENEPSVSIMQHPIYDLRVAGCA